MPNNSDFKQKGTIATPMSTRGGSSLSGYSYFIFVFFVSIYVILFDFLRFKLQSINFD